MPHFALVTVDGDTLGAQELDGVEWPAACDRYGEPLAVALSH